jgi:hypothetical protein
MSSKKEDILELKEELVFLCEGKADQNFLRKLTKKRDGFPEFDTLDPDKFYSNNQFDRMLTALKGNAIAFSKIKGVLIVADSGNDPQKTFEEICKQIKKAGGFGVPSAPLEIAQTEKHPAIAVMLLPDEKNPGGLETLCVKEILSKKFWVKNCLESFLQCDKIQVHTWSPEKQDKSRYHCLVAALNESDPSKAVSSAFKEPHPLIDVTSTCFDEIAKKLIDFCDSVNAITT